jgi:cytochrome c biogenesis protein CcdA
MLGTATATTILGVIAAVAGHMMTNLGGWVRYLVAVVPLVMGAHVLGIVKLPLPKGVAARKRQGLLGAYLTGLLLSLVIGPRGTPALAAILSYAAYRGSVVYGALLLFAYGIGNGLPLLFVGMTAGGLAARLRSATWLRWIERGSGVVLVGLDVYLLSTS